MAPATQIGIAGSPAAPADPGTLRYFALIVAAGLLNALIAAFFFLRLPDEQPSLTRLVLRATVFVLAGALAGTLGAWYYWRRPASPLRQNPPISFTLFALASAAGWVWVPAVVLLSREDSPYTCPVAALAAALLATALRQVIPPRQLLLGQPPTPPPIPNQPLFAATLHKPHRELNGYLLAAGLYFAAYELANGWILDAAGMLAICAFFFVWKWTLEPSGPLNDSQRARLQTRRAACRLAAVVIPAILVTLFTLLDGIGHRGSLEHGNGIATGPAHETGSGDQAEAATRPSANGIAGYHSIILWPVPEKKQILPPLSQPTQLLAPGTTQPFVIRFDGPYFYFQPPHKSPGASAIQVRGTPLGHDIQSNNFVPLVMQAHQGLGTALPVARCREIQVDILNQDNRPGIIHIAVLLGHSSEPANQLYLGQLPVLTSQPGNFAIKSVPAAESLRFAIPAASTLRRFDQISVLFLPDEANYDTGPKVAIQQFQLIPR